MGIEAAIRAANTGEFGLQFIGQDNQVVASFPKEGAFSGTQKLEILRGDLAVFCTRLPDSTSRTGLVIRSRGWSSTPTT